MLPETAERTPAGMIGCRLPRDSRGWPETAESDRVGSVQGAAGLVGRLSRGYGNTRKLEGRKDKSASENSQTKPEGRTP